MENEKQSSIEWLFFELWNTPKDKFVWQSIFEQAKVMHKDEIEEAWNDGHTEGMGWDGCFATYEEYYNETFGGDNE